MRHSEQKVHRCICTRTFEDNGHFVRLRIYNYRISYLTDPAIFFKLNIAPTSRIRFYHVYYENDLLVSMSFSKYDFHKHFRPITGNKMKGTHHGHTQPEDPT